MTFSETSLSSPICEWALPIVAIKGSDYYPSGTAILIAERLALTARHVVEGFMEELGSTQVSKSKWKHSFALQVFQMRESGESGVVWNVKRIWRSGYTDIAVMLLEPTAEECLDFEWKKLALNLLALEKGSDVHAFGFPSPSIEIDASGARRIVRFTHSPTTSSGTVLEVCFDGRSSNLPHPCYLTDARFDPSMSGGPVFDAKGRLCGLICKGWDLLPGEPPISYASALWPLMATEIDLNRTGFPKGSSYPILELARDGFIEAEGWDQVRFGESETSSKKWVALVNQPVRDRLRKMAEQGDAASQNSIGGDYLLGRVVPKDEKKAAWWFRRAADRGSTDGLNNLGMCYSNGWGVRKSQRRAVELFRRAASRGHPEAQCSLGAALLAGNGVRQDQSEAARVFLEGARKGHPASMSNFGVLLSQGFGVDKDLITAYCWLSRAAKAGYEPARAMVEEIGRRLTWEDLKTAQKSLAK